MSKHLNADNVCRNKFENYILKKGQASPINELYREYLNGSKQSKEGKVIKNDNVPFLEKFNKMQLREFNEGINTRYHTLLF